MPKEVKDPEEFRKIAQRARECRVKLGVRRIKTEEGTKRIQVLKVKARTPSYLYTIVFEDIDKGIEFVKSLKDVCKNIVILDAELEPKIKG
ncbi:MAG TPA: 50S ribosomal protein L38e [Pyrodictium sp.]|nr:50S ribosomal protein L38e [Pyrodictium sp.]